MKPIKARTNMFSLFKKQATQPFNCATLAVDMHAHWLPGIDDGAPNIEQSIALIRSLNAVGYKKLIATPHIYWDLYQNTPARIQQALNEVKKAIAQEGMVMDLHAAAEYMLDEHFNTLLQSEEPLLCIHKNWVLVECSYVNPPLDFKEKIFQLQMRGYQPVLAHPERYPYWYHRLDYFQELSDQGVFMQMNLLSILGYYGKDVQRTAEKLLSIKIIDLLGTDMHHERHALALQQMGISDSVQKLIDQNQILNSSL
jgi:tyrosine-protein phosphatase YwqE